MCEEKSLEPDSTKAETRQEEMCFHTNDCPHDPKRALLELWFEWKHISSPLVSI